MRREGGELPGATWHQSWACHPSPGVYFPLVAARLKLAWMSSLEARGSLQKHSKAWKQPGVVVYTFNLGTRETEQ